MPHSSTCFITRHTLSALRDQIHQRPELVMALEGLIEVEEEHFPDPPTYAALSHLAQCTACQAWSALWLEAQFPESGPWRERVARYCCFSMFEAVTKQDRAVRIGFELFRGEDPTWYLNDAICVQFCPWCGQCLPDHPFEPDLQSEPEPEQTP
ncbi:hypothetical protein [Xanthomonas indica]|uniref:Uncharacterized protein n=1 Tax=Xanthomonas indica TaxID=2912242 RepID=A0AAU8I7J2_9XANT|nr:hypothetical protein [Xanthomonas indica]MCI2260614.1 hypothetical protein [Xanthomonas indica]